MKPYPNIRDMERPAGITWGDLTALEPRLEELLWAARRASVGCRRWSEVDPVFVPIRAALTELIGFAGGHQGSHGVVQFPVGDLVSAGAAQHRVSAVLPGETKQPGQLIP